VEGKKIRRERGLASRSHILRLDIAERSFVFFAKLGYGSAVCLEKRHEEGGGEKKMRESALDACGEHLINIERSMASWITNNTTNAVTPANNAGYVLS